ncbi:MAG: hypothetical protein AAFR58_18455 [Cyanobacteria bacterium J06627_28]
MTQPFENEHQPPPEADRLKAFQQQQEADQQRRQQEDEMAQQQQLEQELQAFQEQRDTEYQRQRDEDYQRQLDADLQRAEDVAARRSTPSAKASAVLELRSHTKPSSAPGSSCPDAHRHTLKQ